MKFLKAVFSNLLLLAKHSWKWMQTWYKKDKHLGKPSRLHKFRHSSKRQPSTVISCCFIYAVIKQLWNNGIIFIWICLLEFCVNNKCWLWCWLWSPVLPQRLRLLHGYYSNSYCTNKQFENLISCFIDSSLYGSILCYSCIQQKKEKSHFGFWRV